VCEEIDFSGILLTGDGEKQKLLVLVLVLVLVLASNAL
jgi:hypothetical protein